MARVMFSVCGTVHNAHFLDSFLKELGWEPIVNPPEGIQYVISAGARSNTLTGTNDNETHVKTTKFDDSILNQLKFIGRKNDRISYLPGIDGWRRGTVNFYGEEYHLIRDVASLIEKMPRDRIDGNASTDLKTILAHYGKSI